MAAGSNIGNDAAGDSSATSNELSRPALTSGKTLTIRQARPPHKIQQKTHNKTSSEV